MPRPLPRRTKASRRGHGISIKAQCPHLQEAPPSPSDTGSPGDTIQCGPVAPGVGRRGRPMGCINHPIAWLDGPDHKARKHDPTTYPHIRQWQAFLWLTSQLTTNWIALNNRSLLTVLEVRSLKSVSLGQNQGAGRALLPPGSSVWKSLPSPSSFWWLLVFGGSGLCPLGP